MKRKPPIYAQPDPRWVRHQVRTTLRRRMVRLLK